MRYFAATIAIILLIVIVVFSVQNLGIVDVKFLSLSVSLPKFVVVIIAYALGMVTGGSVMAIFKKARKPRHKEPA